MLGEGEAEKTFTLRFTTNSLCELEEAVGSDFSAVIERFGDEKRQSIKFLRNVFWAGLRENHPDVTTKRAGQIIDEIGMTRAGELIGQAFTRAFPPEAGGKEKAARPPKGGQAGTSLDS